MKKEIPLIITFISGFLLIIAFFVPHEPFGSLEQRFNDWFIIVSGFTLILGVDSLLLYHYKKIKRKEKDAPYSLILIISFVIVLFWGIYSGVKHGNPFAPTSTFLRYFYTYVFVPLQATMFALLAFFISSAAYRAFRARTLNATLLLLSAGIVMLGRVPMGEETVPYFTGITLILISVIFALEGFKRVNPLEKTFFLSMAVLSILLIFPLSAFLKRHLTEITNWIMNTPQLGAKRGLFIGISLGAIAMSVRIILGIERTYLK
ncbi:MAG: hypothetical protein ABDH37_00170 [Candidatus Hydrothermales bacterium]